METVDITLKVRGIDRSWVLINQLSQVVIDNWEVIYIGASRLGITDEEESGYRSEDVTFNRSRLDQRKGVICANGHGRFEVVGPSDEDIRKTAKDIQVLIDAGAEEEGTLLILYIGQG